VTLSKQQDVIKKIELIVEIERQRGGTDAGLTGGARKWYSVNAKNLMHCLHNCCNGSIEVLVERIGKNKFQPSQYKCHAYNGSGPCPIMTTDTSTIHNNDGNTLN
jgi:hypothetical protein